MRKVWAVALAGALCSVAVACGGDDDDTGGATTSPGGPGTTAGPTTTGGGGGGSATTTPAATTTAPADDVVYDTEGTLRIAEAGLPQPLNPKDATSPSLGVAYLGPAYDRLVELRADGSLEPMLATEWSVSDDGLATTFTLREGVTFHDGTPFDADAVVANIEEVLNGPDRLAKTQLAGAAVTGIEKVDEFTVRFLHSDKAIGAFLPYQLASYVQAGGMVSPTAMATGDLTTTVVGTGPYTFVRLEQDRMVYTRNDDYWDTELIAKMPRGLEIIGIGDDQARLNALRSGQADVIPVLNPIPDVEELIEKENLVRSVFTSSSQSLGVYVNLDMEPMNNPEVRKALSMAIDRKGLEEFLGSDTCVASVQPMGKGFPGHVDELDALIDESYDPEEARAILEREGVAGMTLNAISPEPQIFATTGEALRGMFEAVGVTYVQQTVPTSQVAADFRSGVAPLHNSALNGGPEPGLFVLNTYIGLLSPGTEPEELTDLFDTANALALGSPERVAAFEEWSRYIVENPTHLVMCIRPGVTLARANVVGIEENFLQLFSSTVEHRRIFLVET